MTHEDQAISPANNSPTPTPGDFLSAELEFYDDRIVVAADQTPVMMAWERPLMERMAALVTSRRGPVLEIGFGMGISCRAVRALGPKSHVIVEAHPQIIERARPWVAESKSSRLVEGRWQDKLEEIEGHGPYDGISFDVFGGLGQRLDFFAHLGRWLAPKGVATLWIGDDTRIPDTLAELLEKQGFGTTYARVSAIPDRRCTYSQSNEFAIPVIQRPR